MNILAVSFAFPPLAYPRSIQVARLLEHAAEPTALFCASDPGARADNTIEPGAESSLSACIRVPVTRSASGKWLDVFSHRFARGVWNRRNLEPDPYREWGRRVILEAENFLSGSQFKPDVLVTFAQPFTDHLIGLELKRRLQLPWLAHFSDPWADNPFSGGDERTRAKNLRLERMVAESADLLAFTSLETVELFFRKYPENMRSKARILPQCYSSAPTEVRPHAGRIIIRYLGNFYGHRTPEPLISALHLLAREQPQLAEVISFELIGSGDTEVVTKLASGLPPGLLSTRSPVEYGESLELMSQSDGLLVVDAPADTSVFLPSKLIDYVGAGRPIMAITPEGTAATLVRELGGVVANPVDIIGITAAISTFTSLLRSRRDNGASPWGEPRVRERFGAATIAASFRDMLREIGR